MLHGIDTDFLVAVEVREHAFNRIANELLDTLLDQGGLFGIAPQVLAEFTHVITDSRRIPEPLSVSEAIGRAEFWWTAKEVVRVFPSDQSTDQFLKWMRQHRLGRKRLLDTQLASTYSAKGIEKLITNNRSDFSIFGCFDILSYQSRNQG